MIAVSALKPTAADTKSMADAEENLAEVRQSLFPGIVLEVRVRHERDHA